MEKVLLWLDDIRNPLENDWLVFSPIEQPYNVVWVKTYKEFTDWITKNGLPAAICFDHDLSNFQAFYSGFPEYLYDIPFPETEKTGKDCANWLVEYCLDNKLKLPIYNIQSANPVGKENIDGLLKSFTKNYPNGI